MTKTHRLVVLSLALLFSIPLCANIAPVIVKYESSIESLIVKDLSQKRVLYSKESQKIIQPASLTKIMTALIAIESGKMDKIITITKEATQVEPTKGGYRLGEKFYLRDLVKAAMIQSANDAATAIAIGVSGDVDNFVALMNKKAKALGMRNTHFTNPCGFDIGYHVSTANDLLLLSEYAIKNRVFNDIVKLERHDFSATNTKRAYSAYTHNKLLKTNKYAIGIKTGYTSKAGPCLIARSKKGEKDLILVMLNARENRWKSAEEIFDKAMEVRPINTKLARKG